MEVRLDVLEGVTIAGPGLNPSKCSTCDGTRTAVTARSKTAIRSFPLPSETVGLMIRLVTENSRSSDNVLPVFIAIQTMRSGVSNNTRQDSFSNDYDVLYLSHSLVTRNTMARKLSSPVIVHVFNTA